MKGILKYPGSKWRIAEWIISFFPEHHSYLEPYFGSGAVLFNKSRSNIETVNDLDGNVVNLFEWIKRDPERLAKEIYYTPYARQVYEEAFNRIEGNGLYKAVNFYIRCQMGHAYAEGMGYRIIKGQRKEEENGQCEKENDLSVVWSDNGKGGGRQRKGTT